MMMMMSGSGMKLVVWQHQWGRRRGFPGDGCFALEGVAVLLRLFEDLEKGNTGGNAKRIPVFYSPL